MQHYIYVNRQETGPFYDDELDEVQATARQPYPWAYTVHDNGVVERPSNDPRATVCGECGRGWDDAVSTAWTPAPAGRCPFEYEHQGV